MIKLGMMIGDRYEILEKVGSGGMADVFRAKCHRLNRSVAIKFLKQEYCQDAKFVAKFRGEAQSVAGLSHPNIVSIYDVGEDDGMHYIVMEYIEGITLKRYIEEKKKLSVKEACGIGLQIAAGLEAAHKNGIIHRDIKPQNILISRNGTAKVTDFGIAKAATSNTITSNAMGSVHYISPEQARGGFSDEKSDIYSLGITMYEMLTGSVPFSGDSTVAIALAHVQEDATPLAAMDATIPKGLSDIVAKCMQKKGDMRYRTAADLMADLQMFLADPTGTYGILTPLDNGGKTLFIPTDEVKEKRKIEPITETADDNADVEDGDEEEEDDSDVDPKLEKVLVIGSIVVAIIIGLVIIFMLGKFIGLWGGSTPGGSADASPTPVGTAEGMTIVPSVVNMKQEAAQVEFDNNDLIVKFEEQESDTVDEGLVISTNPEVGTQVATKSTVTVYISTGPKKETVPDVTNYSLTDAQTALQDAGFKVSVKESEYSETVESGLVCRTSPAANEKAAPGDTIKVYQSKGKENAMVSVPNLSTMTKSKATSALTAVGLKLGNVTSNYSDSVTKDRVCGQSQPKGAKVKKGTAVDITLSLGAKTTYSYVGNTTITNNPFEYESDPPAVIKLVLNQDGKQTKVYEETKSYADFPLPVTGIVGTSTEGELIVYKDGVRVGAYSITFTRVASN